MAEEEESDLSLLTPQQNDKMHYHSAPTSPHAKHRNVSNHCAVLLPPPSISLQAAPESHEVNQSHKCVMVTPTGSLLAVNSQPGLQLRESTLTVGYSDHGADTIVINVNNNANGSKKGEEEDEEEEVESPGNGNYPESEFLVSFNGSSSAADVLKMKETAILDDDDNGNGDDVEEVSLMYARHEKIPMKDFAAEYRASIEVEKFLLEAQLMLDLHEASVEAILSNMLQSLLEKDEALVEQAMQAMFTHDGVHQLGKTIQGSCTTTYGGLDIDQSWICILCTLPNIAKRRVAIARLRHPANMGHTSQEIYFVILVVAPTKEKGTKNALETGRTFSTLFADMEVRSQLQAAQNDEEFKRCMAERSKQLAKEQSGPKRTRKQSTSEMKQAMKDIEDREKEMCWFGGGLVSDFTRRLKYYPSDFTDGLNGKRSIQKTCSTTLFLYFACLLPCLALGALNDTNTHGEINVKKVIYSQTIGGLFFALFGGQPMVILLTTAPLALYTKVIYTICYELNLDFMAMFAMTGIWNSVFLVIYSFVGASRLMKWSTRSTEEIFALFISIAFTVDTVKDIYHDFQINYNTPACDDAHDNATIATSAAAAVVTPVVQTTDSVLDAVTRALTDVANDTAAGDAHGGISECLRENSLLFLLLVLGTVWLGLSLFNFTKTPFLNASKRELLADYSLPVAVLFMSFFGSYVFRDVKLVPFSYDDGVVFSLAPIHKLSWGAVLGAMGLGFCLSLLFFMDQNISGAMVITPDHKLKKGPAYHWDLLIVAILNAFLTLFGLPMMHGALPHSPLHVVAMADTEDRVDQGHVTRRITHARETRVTGITSHILIGLSILMLPTPLQFIPRPVLDGLFLYLAVTALGSNQMFERIMLLVTEQAAYPPNHYIRSVPQRKIHLFTLFQLIQLAVMCAFGFSPIPYMKMVFPVLILLLLPIRHKLVPKAIEKKYLNAIDGH